MLGGGRPAATQAEPVGSYTLEDLWPGLRFHLPVYVCVAPRDADHLYVVEKAGRIWRVPDASNQGAPQATVFLDHVASTTGDSDRGMLGLAFHPEYAHADSSHAREVFIYYTTTLGGEGYWRLSRFEATADLTKLDPSTEQVLIQQHDRDPLHNGGSLHFGPDGFLYLSVGDEGGQGDPFESSQKIDEDLFSGVLRIDVDQRGGSISHPPPRKPLRGQTAGYYIPSDNPWVGHPEALEEFWAIGFRSPHRMSFDPQTGQLWMGAVGQDRFESVERIGRGTNHRWSYREGVENYRGSHLRGQRPETYLGEEREAVFVYPHEDGNCCIIGGYIYRGQKLPGLSGRYVFADLGSGRAWSIDPNGGLMQQPQLLTRMQVKGRNGPSSFGVDHRGELLICVLGAVEETTGHILRLVSSSTGNENLGVGDGLHVSDAGRSSGVSSRP